MNNKDLNKFIAKLNGDEELYDLRCQFTIVSPGLSLETARKQYENIEPENRHLYSITSCAPYPYSSKVEDAIFAAKNISARNNDTFVLSIEDGQWKACYGDIRDFEEVVGDDPAYVTCAAIYQYFKNFK